MGDEPEIVTVALPGPPLPVNPSPGFTSDAAPQTDTPGDPHARCGDAPPPSPSQASNANSPVEGPAAEVLAPSVLPAVSDPISIPIPSPLDVHDLDWRAIRVAMNPSAIRARMRDTVTAMEGLLDRDGGLGLLFDSDRAHPGDRAIRVGSVDPTVPLWIIGDLHGDLLALEAALAVVAREAAGSSPAQPRMLFLGDLFDDEGFGLEVLLRVFELILDGPGRICVIAGNHDEALSYDGTDFGSGVSPSDFADFLNANLAHEWIERAGKSAIRFFAGVPRALFLPDGLLVAHGGFPLTDLHPRLAEIGNWNDPACLSDFVWTRAHPTARRKMPNRYSRGSQFGHEDFAAFCALSARLGRPVTHMVRGHDHVENRYAIYPAYRNTPMLTTVAISRRLPREAFGPHIRVPTLARFVEGSLPQVYRMHVPAEMIEELYPAPLDPEVMAERSSCEVRP